MSSPHRILRDIEVRPRKAWGQNFLTHPETAEKIVRWARVKGGDVILEIGPGLGALTESLLRAGARVIAIEKDRRLCDNLREKWSGETKIQIMEEDALDSDIGSLAKKVGKSIRVVSNLPYSISTPLLEHLMKYRDSFEDMTLLFQKELVDRIGAQVGTGDYGRLTVWVSSLFSVEKGPIISRGNFFPLPEVDSQLVRLTPLSSPRVPTGELQPFLNLVRKLFQHRRKTIQNCLKSAGYGKDQIEHAFSKIGAEPSRRPQTFSVEEFLALSRMLNSET